LRGGGGLEKIKMENNSMERRKRLGNFQEEKRRKRWANFQEEKEKFERKGGKIVKDV
jgi:hypothetical protein